MTDINNTLRKIPKVDGLLASLSPDPQWRDYPRVHLVAAIRQVLADLRKDILSGKISELPTEEELLALINQALQVEMRFKLRPVINATGIVLHTNLGRALLSPEVANHVAQVASTYNTLEYDPILGQRGSRQTPVEHLLCRLTGAESSLVVNNNAAALFLILAAGFKGWELIVSRGELVEIGGAFRVPAIMEESGTILREVGTTNRTRVSDYEKAIDHELTGGILKVHTSNFRISGYTEETSITELADLARQYSLPLIYDLGSGPFLDLAPIGFHNETTVQQALKAGVDIICFSGDKLLGSAQAGIILGSREYISQLKSHPLARVLRVDKMTLAALEATLRLYLDPEEAKRSIPTLSLLWASPEEIHQRAQELASLLKSNLKLSVELVATESQAGGGTTPEVGQASWGVAVEFPPLSANDLEEILRKAEPPIVTRIIQDKVTLDLRTILPGQSEVVAQVFRKLVEA